MTIRDPIEREWWQWVATTTRSHLVHVHAHVDGAVHLSGDAEQPGRLLTLCRVGPFQSTALLAVDSSSPPECRWCFERWSTEMERISIDDHTRGEAAP